MRGELEKVSLFSISESNSFRWNLVYLFCRSYLVWKKLSQGQLHRVFQFCIYIFRDMATGAQTTQIFEENHIQLFQWLQLTKYHWYVTLNGCHMHWNKQKDLKVMLQPKRSCTVLPGTHCICHNSFRHFLFEISLDS